MHSRGLPPVRGNAERIISEICSHDIPNHLVWIHVCPDLRVPVIGVHHFAKSGIQIDLGEKFGASDEERLRSLAEDSQAMIDAGKFSRVGNYPNQRWTPFNRKRSNLLTQSFGKPKRALWMTRQTIRLGRR